MPNAKSTTLLVMAAGAAAAIAAAVRAPVVTPPPAPAAQTAGFDACRQNFYQGFVPQVAGGPGARRALCFADFAVLHSGQAKTPLFAAEHLTPQSLADARDESRTDKFYEEARLPPAERARLADYQKSGCDRGHLAAAAQRTTPAAMAQSFSLANMVCQAPKLNRGAWAKSVEKATRAYVARGNEVYVLTGPIFRGQPSTIGTGAVWVPNQLFKLVYEPTKRRAWAYVVDNVDSAKVTGTVSYGELVRITGTQWLPAGAVLN
jgi:endonuclease G